MASSFLPQQTTHKNVARQAKRLDSLRVLVEFVIAEDDDDDDGDHCDCSDGQVKFK